MAPKRASSKAAPSVDEAAKAALLAEKKGNALVDTTHQEACEDDTLSKRQRNEQPTPEGSLRTCSSGGQPQPPSGFAPPEGADATEDGEVIGFSAEEQLQLRALSIKNRNLQKQKEILERQRVSAQTKVRKMIRDEEQKAQELEQEIALMQREGQLGLQHGPPLQQHAPIEDPFIPQRGPVFPHAVAFQGVNYLDERSPLAPHLQVSPWPTNFRAGTYPKYNSSTDPAQYIMCYQVAVASSGGDDATMAKSFFALEGPTLTWYTMLPPLSIDSWRGLRDKFLLNFQGYRPDTDALAELSLCKQMERETLREYYRKFLTLKSQLPSVDDQIAIHYVISGLRAGVLYSHCIRDPPKNLQELYQLFENMLDPKSSTSARSSPRGNPRTLRSPAERGRDLRRQTPVRTAAVSSRCTTSPTSTPLVRPLAAKIIPLGPRQRNSWLGPRTGAAATQILLLVPRRRLGAPNTGLPENEGHQRQDVSGATSRQPKSCRAHISTTPTAIQPRPRSAST
jgi:hypothetical protein